MADKSLSEINAPVGLHGELMMMPRVRVVTRSSMAPARIANPSSAYVGTSTGDASASLICSVSVGQYGACVMISSPGPNSDSAVLHNACLPPAVTMTSDSRYSTP